MKASEYVLQQVKYGCDLANKIYANTKIESLLSILGSEIYSLDEDDFVSGKGFSMDRSTSTLVEYLGEDTELSMFVVLDSLARPGDYSTGDSDILIVGGCVVRQASIDSLRDVIKKTNRYPFICFMFDNEISMEFLERECPSGIVVGAYDEEGYVIGITRAGNGYSMTR
ncbi:MAG: hypothetical protein AAGG50_07680 [Bacteroidota bacterium]